MKAQAAGTANVPKRTIVEGSGTGEAVINVAEAESTKLPPPGWG